MTQRGSKKWIKSGMIGVLWKPPLWAIPFALFFGTITGGNLKTFILCYKMSLVFAICIYIAIGAARLFTDRTFRCKPGEVSPGDGWKIGASFMVASLIGAYAAAIIIHFTIYPAFLGNAQAVLANAMFTILFAGLFTGINFARVFRGQAIERARQVELIRAELAEAELRALRAQIHPHFLFNTLNTIAALIAINPAAAEETTTRLAEVFRYTLRASEREHARLGDELAFLRAYLEIEHTRFGERLKILERIEPGLDSVMVPSLLLQPLVENAIRHGVSARPDGGTVTIGARRDGDRLAIEIADDGPGMNGASSQGGTGFGLHSVRERLRAAGLERALEIETGPDRGTRVRISLPLTTESSAPGAESPSRSSTPKTLPQGDAR
jgi:two-component sensor histidine kinase